MPIDILQYRVQIAGTDLLNQVISARKYALACRKQHMKHNNWRSCIKLIMKKKLSLLIVLIMCLETLLLIACVESNPGPYHKVGDEPIRHQQPITGKMHTIACGTFHQGSDFFPAISIGKQCVPNSIVAIIHNTRKCINMWTPQDLDMILLNGNDLYLKKNTNHDYLLVSEIPDIVTLNGKTYKILPMPPIYGLVGTQVSSRTIPSSTVSTSLENTISMLQSQRSWISAVICLGHATAGYSFAIFVNNDTTYICDSHSRNSQGLPDPHGSSVVICLSGYRTPIEYLEQLALHLQCNQYELTQISVYDYTQHKTTEQEIIHHVQSKKKLRHTQTATPTLPPVGRLHPNRQTHTKSSHHRKHSPQQNSSQLNETSTCKVQLKHQHRTQKSHTAGHPIAQNIQNTKASGQSSRTPAIKRRDVTGNTKAQMLPTAVSSKTDKSGIKHTYLKKRTKLAQHMHLECKKQKMNDTIKPAISKMTNSSSTTVVASHTISSQQTPRNYAAEIKLTCKSTASLPTAVTEQAAIMSILYTSTASISKWGAVHLDRIHSLTMSNSLQHGILDIQNMIQDIYISQTWYQFSVVSSQNLYIPTDGSETDTLLQAIEKFNDTKWRYIIITIGENHKSVMTLFVLGSKIYLFEPQSYIPMTLSLSTVNYCVTPVACVLYIQCIGKHLNCEKYTIKEIIANNKSEKNAKHREAQKKYQSVQKPVKLTQQRQRQRQHRDNDKRKYGQNLDENLAIFNASIAEGPTYVCTSCQQLWFKHSVVKVSSLTVSRENVISLLKKCCTKYRSMDNIEWICHTCKQSIYAGKIPRLSIYNGMGFPKKPPELDLHPLEERLVAPRIPFMQIRNLPCGSQKLVHGNIVNVPVDISPTINTLPRTLSDSYTIAVKFKRKKQYKKCAFQQEYVRPHAVWKAAEYLVKNSPLYKELDIQINTAWLNEQVGNQRHLRHFVQQTEQNENQMSAPDSRSDDDEEDTLLTAEHCRSQIDSDAYSDPEDTNNIVHAAAIEQHTLLDQEDITIPTCNTMPMPQGNDETIEFAPGEGQKPISLFYDDNAEYLAFPTIFCGETRPTQRKVPVHYSAICKHELRSVDRRVAKHIPNIFFKLKKTQMKYVRDKIGLVLRRFKTKGKRLTAKDILNEHTCTKLVNLDEGYHVLRSLRNSPPYLQQKKKEAFAMIRQLGFPSLFISLSCAETKWYELLRALGKNVDKRVYTDEEIDNMDWNTKADLIMKDPVTIIEYFGNRYKQFKDLVIDSPFEPIYKVTDYFRRYEFATRGSIHIHMFVYTHNAPVFGEASNEEVAEYYDKIISCSRNVAPEHQQYIKYQMHRHSTKGCRVGNTRKCRFGFPIPPMSKTQILEPIEFEDKGVAEYYKAMWKKIKKHLDDFGMGDEAQDSVEEMLNELDITEDQYIKAVRTSITRPKVFMKRKPTEIRVNQYMKKCFHYWRANHDIQPVLEPFAMVQYILSYVTKAQKGMSSIMDKACNEAYIDHMTLKESVRHIGNAFLNAVETSQQEAVCLLLQKPITCISREHVFIQTSPPDERTYLLKSKKQLEELDEDSEEIQSENLISHYEKRPKQLEDCCLAVFASDYNINIAKDSSDKMEDVDEAGPPQDTDDELTVIRLKNGGTIKKRRISRIVRYVNYNIRTNMELHYRERLMLFTAWRNEEVDLDGGYTSYTQHYNAKKDQIMPIRVKYEKHNDSLQEAIEQVEVEDHDISTDAEDDENTEVQLNDLGFFDPARPLEHITHDIGTDIGMDPKYDTEHHEMHERMSNTDYVELMRSLNKQQREITTHVIQHIDSSDEQMCLFLEGGAGVGKTQCAKAMHQSFLRYYSKGGENPDDQRTLKVAPTGMAAHHIGGNTIHSALYININKHSLAALTSDVLNTLRVKYMHLKVVFIDEISMVGYELFKKLELRLREIKGSDKPFGGLHIVAIGDFYQLAAVQDTPLYRMCKSGYNAVAVHLFRDYFKMYSLTEIMRQKGEKRFCELLNRLRVGKITQEDKEMLESRKVSVTSENYKQHVRHFFPLRDQCKQHNDNIYNAAQTRKEIIECHDIVLNVPAQQQHQCMKKVQESKNYADQKGLLHKLPVAVDLIYILTVNLKTDDGLINGTTCTLKHIHYFTELYPDRPSILWVAFEDTNIGRQWRHRYRELYKSGIDYQWTPIFATQRNFKYWHLTISRKQFPMRPAAATTIHSSQGSTFKEICIDMDLSINPHFARSKGRSKQHLRHAHYVAASRVTSLQGLQIINFNEELINVDEDVSKLLTHMSANPIQLSYTPIYNLPGEIKATYLNTVSLYNHFQDVKTNHNLLSSDIIMLSEARLMRCDNSNTYQLPTYQGPIRNDQHWNLPTRAPHGMVAYISEKLRLIEQHIWSNKDFEAILLVCQHPVYPIIIQYVGIYVSPKATYGAFIKQLEAVMKVLDYESIILIMGDFNMKSMNQAVNYNDVFIQYMSTTYNLDQYIQSNTTSHGSKLDLCFANKTLTTTTIWNHWSDHYIIGGSMHLISE